MTTDELVELCRREAMSEAAEPDGDGAFDHRDRPERVADAVLRVFVRHASAGHLHQLRKRFKK